MLTLTSFMKQIKPIFPCLFLGGILALVLRAFARNASKGPTSNTTSFTAIDTYIKEQMHRLNIPVRLLLLSKATRLCTCVDLVELVQVVKRHHLKLLSLSDRLPNLLPLRL